MSNELYVFNFLNQHEIWKKLSRYLSHFWVNFCVLSSASCFLCFCHELCPVITAKNELELMPTLALNTATTHIRKGWNDTLVSAGSQQTPIESEYVNDNLGIGQIGWKTALRFFANDKRHYFRFLVKSSTMPMYKALNSSFKFLAGSKITILKVISPTHGPL